LNLWSLLLAGLSLFVRVIIIPLFGGNIHSPMGLASSIGQGVYVVLELAIVTFSVFDMRLILVAIGISGLAWGIKAAVRIWMFIKGLIPFAN